MGLQIESVEQLQELAETFDLKVRNLDDLQELLLILGQNNDSSELSKQALEARERRLERNREMEHQERMRAFELGIDPSASQAQAKVAKNAIETAGWIGWMVPLGLAGIAVGTTALIRRHFDDPIHMIIALAIVWGTSALIGIVALLFTHMILQQKSIGLKSIADSESDSRHSRSESTEFQEVGVNSRTY